MRKAAKLISTALLLWAVNSGALAEGCLKSEVLVDEDDHYYYCLSKKVVDDCKAKGGDSNKCIYSNCVRRAGTKLKTSLAKCSEGSETCLHQQGAPATLIKTIVACIAGTAATQSAAGCFAPTAVGAFEYDTKVALCRQKYGECSEDGLKEHRGFVTACSKYK